MRRLTALAIIALAAPARATEYESFIDVDSEEDLYDLLADESISQDTFDDLLELMRRGVDLDEASREELYSLPNLTYAEVDAILAYRKEAGFIGDPAVLVTNGVLGERKLAAIAAFLVVHERGRSAYATDGFVRYPAVWSVEDTRAPAMGLQVRVSTYKKLTAGAAAVLTRNRLGDVVYDPNRMALSAEAPGTAVHLPKLYAQWEAGDWGVIAGSYRIGFGQRLTFDNTSRYTPNGFYLDDAIFRDTTLTRQCKESAGELDEAPCDSDLYVTPDYRWRAGLRGLAGGARRIPAGSGWLQLYGFVSHEPRSIYQYEIYDRARCADPADDDDPACAAPEVFARRGDLLEPTSRFSFQTLPDLFAELTAGGNVSYFQDRRSHIGLTAYGSDVQWLTEGGDLDFQEWSAYPRGGPFGAVGLDVALGRKWADLFLEVTRSFDSAGGAGGGTGGVLRGVATRGKEELEATLRWYGRDFANPYARPIAAPDETDGLRARDELGARLRYTGVVRERLSLRSAVDVWQNPSTDILKTLLYLRSDYEASDRWRFGLWTQYQDKGLSVPEDEAGAAGSEICFEVPIEEDERGEPIPCAGNKYQLTGRAKLNLARRTSLSAQYQHAWVDDPRYPDRMRQDLSAWLMFAAWPSDALRLRARARYLSQDISDAEYLEESLWTYVDLAWRVERRYRAHLRYDIYVWLDDRDLTASRRPSPEHWLWLELEARF